MVSHEPVGVVAAIIPFNGPFAMGVAKTAGALMAGCSVILKPSPEGALHVEVQAEAYAAAGFPAGVVNVLPGGGEAGARLDRKSTRLNSSTNAHLVCRLLLEK